MAAQMYQLGHKAIQFDSNHIWHATAIPEGMHRNHSEAVQQGVY